MRSLVDNVRIGGIGGQEGLSYEFITESINKVVEPQRQLLDNITLIGLSIYVVTRFQTLGTWRN
jgi:hypothetical protein